MEADNLVEVIWPYTRDEQSFEIETCYDENTAAYLVIWRYPDGTGRTERFSDQTSFSVRCLILEQELTDDGWDFSGVTPSPRDWVDRSKTVRPSHSPSPRPARVGLDVA